MLWPRVRHSKPRDRHLMLWGFIAKAIFLVTGEPMVKEPAEMTTISGQKSLPSSATHSLKLFVCCRNSSGPFRCSPLMEFAAV